MTIRSREPSHSTREPLIPECESVMVMGVEPVRGSKSRNFLSLQVLLMLRVSATVVHCASDVLT